MDPYNTPELQSAYGSYEESANKAIEYNSAASMLPQKLKEAINEKLDYNKDLIEKKNQLASDYFNAPSEARAKYADQSSPNAVWNPMQAEALVSQYRNQAWQPYQTASDVLTARTGSIADIIDSASNAMVASATTAKDKATLARQKWEDLFSVAKQKESDKSTAASGGTGFDDMFVVDPTTGQLTLNPKYTNKNVTPENSIPTEPEPIVDMTGKDPNVKWRSPEGQWEYNWQYMAWVPVGADVVE